MRLFSYFFMLFFTLYLNSEAQYNENSDDNSFLLREHNVDYGKKAVRIPSNIQRTYPSVPQVVVAPPAAKSELCEALTGVKKPERLEDHLHNLAMDLCGSLKDESKNFGTKYRACTTKTEIALAAILEQCFTKQ